MAALSQLSYGPLFLSKCSGEIEVVSPVNPPPLIVSARCQAQSDRRPILHEMDWDKEASIEFEAIGAYCVDLLRRIPAANESVSASTGALAADD